MSRRPLIAQLQLGPGHLPHGLCNAVCDKAGPASSELTSTVNSRQAHGPRPRMAWRRTFELGTSRPALACSGGREVQVGVGLAMLLLELTRDEGGSGVWAVDTPGRPEHDSRGRWVQELPHYHLWSVEQCLFPTHATRRGLEMDVESPETEQHNDLGVK
ncbi:hypothetical protein VTK26DRAFT_8795 [Humicola hyalothermophila]